MKKLFGIICLTMILIFLSTLPAAACWMQPKPFEIVSEDGNRVFVFIPSEDGLGNAYAAVYEIINNERQIVYAVENLSSFAYKRNFHFSADMMHFARIFPPYGMPTFEVFSKGVRTRVVMRNDFIENYAEIESFTSIGPFYTVTWKIEEHPTENTIITIITNEDDILLFDLLTADFISENILLTCDRLHFIIAGSALAFTGPGAFFITQLKNTQ